jgi:hypothetical protein
MPPPAIRMGLLESVCATDGRPGEARDYRSSTIGTPGRLCIVLTGRSVKAMDRFVETIATNRGAAIYFDDYEAARRWLLS